MSLLVLMVAEKPSLAERIAYFLSKGEYDSRRGATDVMEWDGSFQGRKARYRMTSVIGHVFSLDFTPDYQGWDRNPPEKLFLEATTQKNESNPKAHIVRHLAAEGRGADHLVLWLDCDREGENICFEVMDSVLPKMNRGAGRSVHRARFSAVSSPEIHHAMDNLTVPNESEALSVDARQELDLKVGVAFSRFQTMFFQGKYGDLDSSILSYGPCQTPTLGFCVERHTRITSFIPEAFWVVRPRVTKGGTRLDLEWDRGRLFDQAIGQLFQRRVQAAGDLLVASVEEREDRRGRPAGLNTVEMLKVASSSLNIGPHAAMQMAEGLYMQGFISYPRTESSAYPPNFDFDLVLGALTRSDFYGDYARGLWRDGFTPSKGGTDAGDHPPITPVREATEAELGDMWRLYDYIARHFLASISPDCVLKKTKATFECGGEGFSCSGSTVIKPGFTAVMPWRAPEGVSLPAMRPGDRIPITEVELYQGRTSPPDYLTESELIGLMEQHGIGTDASIATHINNVCERNYVRIDQSGRRCIPTELGITLIRGYQQIDPDLCLPQVRAHIERQILLVAQGQANKEAVVRHALREFHAKFLYFVANIAKMDALFEASFTSLSKTGKPLSKCGKCNRYIKYISARPQRLYCSTCEEVHQVPQGGTIKLYKGLTCPLDGYELVLFSLSGADGKVYPFCPQCFNNPPFEDALKVGLDTPGARSGMSCSTCPHSTCAHSMVKRAVCPCPHCEQGTLVLDPVSAPIWRLDCNKCSFMLQLPGNLYSVTVEERVCEECAAALLRFNFKKGNMPPTLKAEEGTTEYVGCPLCEKALLALCEAKNAQMWVRRGGGGGRGRGRGRGRGGRRKLGDPKLSFDRF